MAGRGRPWQRKCDDRATAEKIIQKQKDDDIIRGIERACGLRVDPWYNHRLPYHRMYLHILYEEARRRGLTVPAFVSVLRT